MKMVTSTDGGATFGKPVPVTDGTYGHVAIDGAGTIHLVTLEASPNGPAAWGSPDNRIVYTRSTDGTTFSAPAVVNAITSCCVVCSISSMRAISKAPRSRMSRAASGGTMPAAAIASAAAVSTASQVSYRRWSLQIRPISGCVYRAITSIQIQPLFR
jgi:hypothetical protein